jgi:hypothetical protein
LSRTSLEKILVDLPAFHRGDTETTRIAQPTETSLGATLLDNIAKRVPACYGITPDLARFLFDAVPEESKTLETGAGVSTLVFALRKCKHLAVTPSSEEVTNIREYAASNSISLDTVEFVVEPSDQYLPRCVAQGLDLVLIDGKHAFPWPIIDWFFTADKLKKGGIVVLDDIEMSSVSILGDFLLEDPCWKLETSRVRRSLVFRKLCDSVHDVSWHMQPYITRRYGRRAKLLNLLGLKRRF